MNNFEYQLQVGKIGESYIAKWLQNKGCNILPVYEKEINEGKGPTLFKADRTTVICPDMLCFKNNSIFWVEAKHKTAFSWHRKTKRWVTGIDLNHYTSYLEVANNLIGWPVVLMFLHKDGTAKDTPEGMVSPTGLYGGDIRFLSKNENHRHSNWGRHGMVYWNINSLMKFE